MPDSSSAANINVDINQIATDLNGKADVDLTNTAPSSSFATILNTSGIRTVVEYGGTVANWYRLWSDGWLEQGGIINGTTNTPVYVTFLKPYASPSYNITGSCIGQNTSISDVFFGVMPGTNLATSMSVCGRYLSTAGQTWILWQTSGWAA